MTIATYVLASACGLVSYWSSRGHDGKLFDALNGFSVIAVLYSVLVSRRDSLKPNTAVLDFLLFEVCIIAGMLVQTKLEEMGGMLYIILPSLGLVVVLVGLVVRFVVNRLAGS